MTFSVIIPCYNCAETLEATVKSVCASGLIDYEILLIDDGSTDGTAELCDSLCAYDPAIRCIHQENAGVSAARNCGIREAQGDYLWFVDADDTVDAGSLVRAVEIAIHQHPDMLLFGMSFDYYHRGCMPAFFVLSGMLTDIEKWRAQPWTTYILHKAKTLLVPYLFFEVLAILYKHFILHSVSLLDGIYQMVTMRCNVGADWFLPAMFLACLIFYLYIRYPNKLPWGVAAVLALVALPHFPSGHGWTLLFRGALGFVFMLAGNLLKKQLHDVK